MYQPAHGHFTVADPAAHLAILAAAVPATLVTLSGGELCATILPMLYDPQDGPHGTLRGHVARPNPQWRDIAADLDALALFDGPETYISPAFYEEKRRTGRVVPTWNYVTVQARGRLELRHEPEWLVAHVRGLVEHHEAGRADPWSLDDAPADYITTQARAIVGFEMRVTRIDAKRKLSQNRNAADVDGVIAGLSAGMEREQAVAAEMRDDPRRPGGRRALPRRPLPR